VKLGILGGSFNPVHLGHLFLADKALVTLKLDMVVLVPAYCSPFKLEAEGMESGADDRLAMLAAAVCGDSRLALDDCEIRREGVSYTVDTVEDIIARYMPSGKPSLIIGDDIAGEFPRWHKSEKLLKLADIVVARRLNSAVEEYPYAHRVIENEVINISSHDVRRRIKEGGDWRSLVPSGVRAVIEDRQLYGYARPPSGEDCTHENIMRIETAARQALSTGRFLHSRNTALLAQELCRRFGLDPMAGYLAGIAHDLAKQMDSKQMVELAKMDGREITEIEKGKLNLLHGRAAAVLLKESFCINNKDVLEAVSVHTLGSENMGPLAKVIYVADKTEVSRNIDPALRKMCYEEELDAILLAVLYRTINKLKSKKLELSEETLRLLEKMEGKNA
jgi:nicotinate-nucleotide adenylyltransferase